MRSSISAALAAALACTAWPAVSAAADAKQAPAATATSKASPAPSTPPGPGALPAPAPPSGPETADSLYNQGNDAYDRGDYSLAFELYTGAFKLRKSYDIARNLGLAELKLGRFKDAIEHFEYSLFHYPSNRADTKKQVVEWLAQAKERVGTVRIEVEPESAVCRVNGAEVTSDAREAGVVVDPGQVKIDCGGVAGLSAEKRTVTVEQGARETVAMKLAPAGPQGPNGNSDAAAGPLGVWGTGDRRLILTWVGAAAATAGLGVGAAMGVLSLVKAGEADGLLGDLRAESGRASPCAAPAGARCGELLALRREQDAFGNVAFWTLLAGGLAGAGTAAYVLVTQPRAAAPSSPAAPPPKAALAPVVGPGAAGVVLTGAF